MSILADRIGGLSMLGHKYAALMDELNDAHGNPPPDDVVTWGSCRNHPPQLFFSTSRTDIEKAKRICVNDCAVYQECREWVLQAPASTAGVWGGTSQRERHEILWPSRAEARQRRLEREDNRAQRAAQALEARAKKKRERDAERRRRAVEAELLRQEKEARAIQRAESAVQKAERMAAQAALRAANPPKPGRRAGAAVAAWPVVYSKGGSGWRARVRVDGRNIQVTVRTKHKATALATLREKVSRECSEWLPLIDAYVASSATKESIDHPTSAC